MLFRPRRGWFTSHYEVTTPGRGPQGNAGEGRGSPSWRPGSEEMRRAWEGLEDRWRALEFER